MTDFVDPEHHNETYVLKLFNTVRVEDRKLRKDFLSVIAF